MLRILGGEKKGFKLISCNSKGLRPIPAKVKEAIFNILGESIVAKSVLDVFAGTGSFGLEALSRGASYCCFVELNRRVFEILKKNISILGYQSKTQIYNVDAFRFIRDTTKEFDYIYVAPPQFQGLAFKALFEIFSRPSLVASRGTVIAQIDKREKFDLNPAFFELVRDRIYGDTYVLFFNKKDNL